MRDEKLEELLNPPEKVAWHTFKKVTHPFGKSKGGKITVTFSKIL